MFKDLVTMFKAHNTVIDNSTKPRIAGAIALMSTGNLEGSWYFLFLANEQNKVNYITYA